MAYSQEYLNQIKQFGFTDPNEYKQAYQATNQARQIRLGDQLAKDRLAKEGFFQSDAAAKARLESQGMNFGNKTSTVPSLKQNKAQLMIGGKPVSSYDMAAYGSTDFPIPTEAQQSATSREVTPYDPMAAFQGSILERNKRMDDALIQGMQNEQGIQNMNAINQVTNYNNNQQAQMNRTANSMRAGSFTPQYQQAVAYTPQSFNFGQQQAPAMTFGNVPTEGMPRGGTINGVPVFGKQGERLNVSMDALRQAGTDMQAKNQFVDANNQYQTKKIKGGFTANNEFNPMINNIGKRNIFNMGF